MCNHNNRAFTLFLSIIVAAVVLSIGLALLELTLRQFKLGGLANESVIALNAADAGLECFRYWDRSDFAGGIFDIGPGATPFDCMGQTEVTSGLVASGDRESFEFEWGVVDTMCTKLDVYKYFDSVSDTNMQDGTRRCPAGFTCTQVESRGYNVPCDQLNNNRVVERAIRATFGGVPI